MNSFYFRSLKLCDKNSLHIYATSENSLETECLKFHKNFALSQINHNRKFILQQIP